MKFFPADAAPCTVARCYFYRARFFPIDCTPAKMHLKKGDIVYACRARYKTVKRAEKIRRTMSHARSLVSGRLNGTVTFFPESTFWRMITIAIVVKIRYRNCTRPWRTRTRAISDYRGSNTCARADSLGKYVKETRSPRGERTSTFVLGSARPLLRPCFIAFVCI